MQNVEIATTLSHLQNKKQPSLLFPLNFKIMSLDSAMIKWQSVPTSKSYSNQQYFDIHFFTDSEIFFHFFWKKEYCLDVLCLCYLVLLKLLPRHWKYCIQYLVSTRLCLCMFIVVTEWRKISKVQYLIFFMNTLFFMLRTWCKLNSKLKYQI